ncbi:pentatricopeptide repeat-containing protein At2g29760, chloroplastic-like [Elaeis guineensis]|uniref:Pentatricopeptide repeat-containing protein At5g66520-like n=1 Tax=Elaeis guineensis var. tenera TaxID=51953 RepID=A0A6I9S7R9_ELAGV|nr:pentatricopeptide repeat-containing protein At5g66520-like [Elaeis guineensis]
MACASPFPIHPAKTLERRVMSLIQEATTLPQLLQIHSLLLKTSLDRSIFVLAKFLRRCFAFSSPQALPHGRSIFDRIHAPDTFLWNTLIRAYLQSQEPVESLHLFHKMRLREGVTVDSFSISLALQACGRSGESTIGRAIHTHLLKVGFVSDLFVQTALVEMYAKVGDVSIARRVFDEMPERDLVSYNVMLAEYVGCDNVQEARRLFDEMPDRDLVSWNTMIHGYAMSGDLHAAQQIFDRTHEKDLFSWSLMISAYAQSRQSSEALRLFREMQLANVVPDKVTMVSVLSACGDLGALSMGKVIHRFIERKVMEVDLRLGTSLVDMYAKCGDIDSSLGVFLKLSERDVLTWSSMIIGLANHGLGMVALDFFSKMISEQMKPNEITFVGVLMACGHAGLVSEGRAHFNSMSDVHGISPTIEHYGCMVDLLGRAGHIEEARQFIKDMPFEPDAVVWRALLGACRIHKNVEVAEEAIAKLVDLEPLVDGHYVLSSNIFAHANRWDGVANLRKMMRSKSIQKVPGSSSIEVDDTVYEFVAGDKSHPRCDEIYRMLNEMIDRLKQAGYRPMISFVLQDVDETLKECILIQHSEKLAIAFGLLTSPPKSIIRIMKNLRVCEDCHWAIKLVSLVYDRQLIIRDRNRFHHFAKGKCSCRDYW